MTHRGRLPVWLILLAVLPLRAGPLPDLAWPAGTQVETLSVRWFGADARIRAARIPLSLPQALDALVANAHESWQIHPQASGMVLVPAGGDWQLTLQPDQAQTLGVLSHLSLAQARAAPRPGWLSGAWVTRLAMDDGDGARWVFSHPARPAHLAAALAQGLEQDGWQREPAPAGARLAYWHKGTRRLMLALVPAGSGAGLYVHDDAGAFP